MSRNDLIWGRGEIGRRNGLKIRWEKSRVGSSPTVPTIDYFFLTDDWFRSQVAKAIDCNSVIIGSNPIGTSITWGRGEIGRRNGLKIRWEKSRVGSSPTVPTIL